MASRAYTPRLERQLDGSSNQGMDCGRATAVMLVDFATKGRIRPETEQIGRRMDRPTGPSNSGNQKVAVESYDNEARWYYMRPLNYARKRGAAMDQLDKALTDGHMLSIDMRYRVFNDNYKGKYSCSRTFNGLHSIAIWGKKRINGTWMTRVYDPLADGRRKGVWNGPRWVPLSLVKKSTSSVWGRSKWGGGIVKYTPRVPRPEELEIRAQKQALKGEVKRLNEELEAALENVAIGRDDLAALQFALSEARDSFEDIKAQLESQIEGLIIDITGVIEEIDNAMPPNTDQADVDPDEDAVDDTPQAA